MTWDGLARGEEQRKEAESGTDKPRSPSRPSDTVHAPGAAHVRPAIVNQEGTPLSNNRRQPG